MSQCVAFVATQTVVSVSASVTGAGVAGATGILGSVGDVRASTSTSVARQVVAASSNTAMPSLIQTVARVMGGGGVYGSGIEECCKFLRWVWDGMGYDPSDARNSECDRALDLPCTD